MPKLGRAFTGLIVLALVATAAPVLAHDHSPPKVQLRSRGERQKGRAWTYTWAEQQGDLCAIAHADGVPNYRRRAMKWKPKNSLRLLFFKRQRPEKVSVRMHRRLDEDGFPKKRGKRAEVELRRKKRESGRRIWIAEFMGVEARRLYLSVSAVWEDVDDCIDKQSMDMAFHIRRK